jgi:signal transduction histidine kinase
MGDTHQAPPQRNELDVIKMKEDFLSTINHDIKNPLGRIKVYAEMLKDSPRIAEDEIVLLDQILVAALSAEIQINNLLNASKIRNSLLSFDIKITHLKSLAEEVELIMRPFGSVKEIGIKTDIEGDIWVRTDAVRIEEVLVSLLDNALKNTQRGGSITIVAVRDGEKVRISVADTGRGVAEDDQTKIWHIFEQGRGQRGGVGLGLYIAKSYLDGLGEEIAFRTEAGRGSTFVFSLPLANPSSE